jgi:hypothetical protein
MNRSNTRVGFDDRLIMVGGILLFSVLVPIVFFGWRIGRPPYLNWTAIWTSLVTVSTIWIGCRVIMLWARKRYPQFNQVRKRLWVQTELVVVYALLACNLEGWLFKDQCEKMFKLRVSPLSFEDVLISSNAAALLCTALVIAIYEGVYFMNELRQSIEEKEMLKRETLQAQLNALKTQVNPHFLFNNLNTLSAVIPENPSQAIDFVQQLSKVYRHILEVKDEPSILLREELDVLKAYSFLLKTRFGENLDITIEVPEEKLQQRIVPLSLQILMENAIKHNIVSAAKPLRIDIFAENGRLIVSNNLQKKNQPVESTGIGLDNLRNRYRLLSNRQVQVEEGPSSFTVSIPLIRE